jgi:hypothetical protein
MEPAVKEPRADDTKDAAAAKAKAKATTAAKKAAAEEAAAEAKEAADALHEGEHTATAAEAAKAAASAKAAGAAEAATDDAAAMVAAAAGAAKAAAAAAAAPPPFGAASSLPPSPRGSETAEERLLREHKSAFVRAACGALGETARCAAACRPAVSLRATFDARMRARRSAATLEARQQQRIVLLPAARSCAVNLFLFEGDAQPQGDAHVAVFVSAAPDTGGAPHGSHPAQCLRAGGAPLRRGARIALTLQEASLVVPRTSTYDISAHARHFGIIYTSSRDAAAWGVVPLRPFAVHPLPDAAIACRPLAVCAPVESVLPDGTREPHAFELAFEMKSHGHTVRLRAALEQPAGAKFVLASPSEFERCFESDMRGVNAAPNVTLTRTPATCALNAGAPPPPPGTGLLVRVQLSRAVRGGEELYADEAACRHVAQELQRLRAEAAALLASLA